MGSKRRERKAESGGERRRVLEVKRWFGLVGDMSVDLVALLMERQT